MAPCENEKDLSQPGAVNLKTEDSPQSISSRVAPAPEILHKIVQQHQTRIKDDWKGQHVLEGYQKMLDKNSVLVCSNDYLDLGREPVLLNLQAQCILEQAKKSKERSPIKGDIPVSPIYMYALQDNPICKFEQKMAQFLRSPDGIVCQSGFAANSALIQCITGPSTPVYLDAATHMSAWAGLKLSNARPLRFRHNDLRSAEKLVKLHGPGVIVVDSVYSTDGSVCPLVGLVELAEKYHSILVVDEAHSIGSHGPEGRGIVAAAGLEDRVTFRTFSLSKTFAGRAGFITCSREFKDMFMSQNFPVLFSSCLQRHDIVWLDGVLDLLPKLEDRRERLRKVSREFRQQLKTIGFEVADGSEQICALVCKSEAEASELDKILQSHGVFGSLFVHPAAPKNAPFVRLSMNTGLKDEEISRVLQACRLAYQKIGESHYQTPLAA